MLNIPGKQYDDASQRGDRFCPTCEKIFKLTRKGLPVHCPECPGKTDDTELLTMPYARSEGHVNIVRDTPKRSK